MSKSIPAFESVFDGFKSPSSFFSDQVKVIEFTIVSGGTVDPITGAPTGETSTFYSAEGFSRNVKKEEFREVLAGDLVFTCKQSDLNYSPSINDKCEIDGVTYTVVEVMDLGQVSYAIQLRG